MMEFVIDEKGNVATAKVIKGGNIELNNHLMEAFENLPAWKPAVRQEKPVAVKLKQSIFIEKPESTQAKANQPERENG